MKHPIPKGDTKKVAAIMTEYRFNSHADVIVGRLLGDFDYRPQVEVVSMYTDQVPANDMSREEAARCGIPIYPTIAEAIRAGGVPVDGVVIIGEHGDYPENEKRQKMYPRRRFLEETLNALDGLGRQVPIFSDKHLSYHFADSSWMYGQLKRRGIPFMGGSSIPWTDHVPPFDRRLLASAREWLVVSYSTAIEAYGFHGLEVLQSLAERRAGGETGVKSVHAIVGSDVWAALDRGEWAEDLLLAALKALPDAPSVHPREVEPDPALFLIEYKDGTRGSVIQFRQFVRRWGFAFRCDNGATAAARCDSETERPFRHFERLTQMIERFIISGTPPFPMERTYLTTGMINFAMESLYLGKKLETPELSIVYRSD